MRLTARQQQQWALFARINIARSILHSRHRCVQHTAIQQWPLRVAMRLLNNMFHGSEEGEQAAHLQLRTYPYGRAAGQRAFSRWTGAPARRRQLPDAYLQTSVTPPLGDQFKTRKLEGLDGIDTRESTQGNRDSCAVCPGSSSFVCLA